MRYQADELEAVSWRSLRASRVGMTPSILQHLDTFVDKADKLRRFGFEDHVKKVGLGWRMSSGEEGRHIIEFDLPDEMERDAFILTFRLFTQQNEPFSFHKLDGIASDSGMPKTLGDKLRKSRKEFFDYLNGYPSYISDLFGPRPTRKEILDVVMYCEIAHTRDKKRRQLYKEWARDDIRENVLLQTFTVIVLVILFMIYSVADAIRDEISE